MGLVLIPKACIRASHVVAELDDVERGGRRQEPPIDGGSIKMCKVEL